MFIGVGERVERKRAARAAVVKGSRMGEGRGKKRTLKKNLQGPDLIMLFCFSKNYFLLMG